jgi:hypothetical protein
MPCHQTVVWIDSRQACIVHLSSSTAPEAILEPSGDQPLNRELIEADASGDYFRRVARAIDIADQILVVGPSNTKLEFVNFMHKNDHARDPRILGVETVACPTDALLAAFARLYFSSRGSGPPSSNGYAKAE